MTIRTVVADDDDDLRRLLCMALEMDGRFEVIGEAADGSEALRLVDAGDADLLLLDLAMPNMDGLEVLAALDCRPRPTVVVMSGFSNDNLIERARGLGAAAYLTKGEDVDRIPDVLSAAVNGGA